MSLSWEGLSVSWLNIGPPFFFPFDSCALPAAGAKSVSRAFLFLLLQSALYSSWRDHCSQPACCCGSRLERAGRGQPGGQAGVWVTLVGTWRCQWGLEVSVRHPGLPLLVVSNIKNVIFADPVFPLWPKRKCFSSQYFSYSVFLFEGIWLRESLLLPLFSCPLANSCF